MDCHSAHQEKEWQKGSIFVKLCFFLVLSVPSAQGFAIVKHQSLRCRFAGFETGGTLQLTKRTFISQRTARSFYQSFPRRRLFVQRKEVTETVLVTKDLSDEKPPLPAPTVIQSDKDESRKLAAPGTLERNESPSSSKVVMFGLLWITACLSALDRIAMSVAVVPMSAEFLYSDTTKGSISSLLSIGYGLTILPAGLLVATISPRLLIVCGIAVWSLSTVATPLVASMGGSLVPLLAARALVGAGESIVLPTTQRFLTEWAKPEEKSRSLAFVYSGFAAGTVAAYLISPIVMEQLGGWRDLFYVYGSIGLLVLIPWILFAQDSPTGETRNFLANSGQFSVAKAFSVLKEAPWGALLRSKGAWAMLLAHSAKNWGLYNSLAWTPTFYAEQYGIGVKESAWLSIGPSIVGALGGFLAGFAADRVVRDLNDACDVDAKTRIRKGFQSIGLLGPALALGVLAWYLPEDPWQAQLFLSASFGLQSFNAGGYEAANQEKAGSRWAGLLYSVTSLPAVMLGTVGVYVTGRLLDSTGQDWSLVFGINAAINVLGAAAFLALYDSKKEFD